MSRGPKSFRKFRGKRPDEVKDLLEDGESETPLTTAMKRITWLETRLATALTRAEKAEKEREQIAIISNDQRREKLDLITERDRLKAEVETLKNGYHARGQYNKYMDQCYKEDTGKLQQQLDAALVEASRMAEALNDCLDSRCIECGPEIPNIVNASLGAAPAARELMQAVQGMADAINAFNRPHWVLDDDWRKKEEAQGLYAAYNRFRKAWRGP